MAESERFTLEDEEFEDIIPIYAAAAISNDHEDCIDDPNSYKAATRVFALREMGCGDES